MTSITPSTFNLMNSEHIIRFNLQEARRRSLILWKNLPAEIHHWKPDNNAMTVLQMVRHVLEGEHLDLKIIESRGELHDYLSPWKNLPFVDMEAELRFAEPFRSTFMNTVEHFTPEDLDEIKIYSSESGKVRKLGDFLLSIAYHEAVHAGQLLAYLRTFGVPRPSIWI